MYIFFQPARHTKLEKADILEMAVKHLQNVQRQQLALAMATDSSVLRKFKTGFNECASEIDRCMGQIEGVDNAMKQRVSTHLQKCINGIEQVAQINFPGFGNLPFLSGNPAFTSSTASQTQLESSASVGDQNNNPRIQIPQGIQLIPSRLPSGELALLVPNSSNMPYFPTAITATIQNRPSAFATVVSQPSSNESVVPKTLSPPVSPREEYRVRNPSPHGFRPVLPSAKQKNYSEDHQVPQISSTSVVIADKHQFVPPMEVKTLKFPISKKIESPKKIAEPLCIITNQSERYKQAQMKEDSACYPENIVQRGIKRKYPEVSGLLTVAQPDLSYPPPSKMIRTEHILPSTSFVSESGTSSGFLRNELGNNTQDDSMRRDSSVSSKEGSMEGSSDNMWRPW